MRIDSSQVLAQSGLKVKADKGPFSESLKEGQAFKAEVLSVERDIAVLKTADGEVFKAKLETDAELQPGDKVMFKVLGRESGYAVLSLNDQGAESGKSAEYLRLVWDFDDKSLAPQAGKLAELNMPVTEAAARTMREIIANNPGMTLDDAAFIASNKISGDQKLVDAARSMLSDDGKTGAIIERILTMLDMPETAGGSAPAADNNLEPKHSAPLTDWLAQTGENTVQGETEPAKNIITHNEGNLQSRNIVSDEKILHNPVFDVEKQAFESDEQRIDGREALETKGTAVSDNTESAAKIISKIIAEIPEFRGTPEPALEKFSNMLLRVAGESADISGGDFDKLKNLLEKLFTRIEKNDGDAGMRLRNAKDELFARLALAEEAISRASPPTKEAMIEQTRNLMDHVRLMNNIGQFAYIELPVKFGEEHKTAELYLFKRKGGRRPDPENVNILLALDLENMGRWEALLNIRTKDVSIQMEVRGAEEKEFFTENTVLLHNMLDEAGFRLTSASVSYIDKATSPLTALCTLDKHTSGRGGSIDFKI